MDFHDFSWSLDLLSSWFMRNLFQQYLRHHAFVFMVEKMAMKDRHAANRGIGEIDNHVDRSDIRNAGGINPFRIWQSDPIDCVHQKMHLMEMHGVQFPRLVYDPPVLISSHPDLSHRT